jgi:DNA-binding MurR/RpiR family transcriptional regulator
MRVDGSVDASAAPDLVLARSMSHRRESSFECFESLEKAIVARFPMLSKRLRQIAVYALANPGEVALETTTVLARRAGVQPSSLIRFANAFGFSGYSQMQTVFRMRLTDDLAERERSGDVPSSSAATLLDQLVQADVKGLQWLLQKGPSNDLIERACWLMADAGTAYLVASGSSFPIACYLAYALGQMNVRSVLVSGIGGMLFHQTQQATPRDVVVAITSRPYSSEVVQVVRESKKGGVPTIVLADSRVNPLTKHADVMLEAMQPEVHAFRSLAVPMTLALTLVVRLGRLLQSKRTSSGLGTTLSVAGRLGR